MNAPLPGDFKLTSPALAVGLAIATLVLTPIAAFAASSTTFDDILVAGDFQEYPLNPLGVRAGDKVTINITVQEGDPPVDFYFVNQPGLEQLSGSWPTPGTFGYFAEFSSLNATSIHETVDVPSDGFYYLVIANDDQTRSARTAGTIETVTPYPTLLITIAIVLISVGAVVAVVVAVMVRRSFRSRLSHYSPPGRPTPPSLAHQHMQAQRSAVHQELDRTCPKCGSTNPKGATICRNCGVRL
jgi:ribosomal protein L40E